MAIVVVGGQTRNIGKSSVVAGLIAGLPERNWTAFKITQFGHGVCSAHGKPCDCDAGPHTIAISEERDRTTGTDSARFLAAGAVRAFWVRTRQGQLAEAMPRIRKELASAENAILESNSILNFLDPDVYLTVLDPSNCDFKDSAKNFLDRADAVLWSGGELPGVWPEVLQERTRSKPQFRLTPPTYTTGELAQFVASLIVSRKTSPGNHGLRNRDCARAFRLGVEAQ